METVEDILRDIRSRDEVACRQDEDATVHHSAVAAMLHDLHDRLDAAYKRDLQSMVAAGEIDMRTAMGEVARLREENARLRSAIVRVHGCTNATCGCIGACWTCEVMRNGGAE